MFGLNLTFVQRSTVYGRERPAGSVAEIITSALSQQSA